MKNSNFTSNNLTTVRAIYELAVIKNDNNQLMKHLTLFLAISGIAFCSYGQTTFKRNDIYLEAGGNGLFASINYERQLTKQPGLGFRLDVGFYSENAFYLTNTSVNFRRQFCHIPVVL